MKKQLQLLDDIPGIGKKSAGKKMSTKIRKGNTTVRKSYRKIFVL